jgi:hypothetical protein
MPWNWASGGDGLCTTSTVPKSSGLVTHTQCVRTFRRASEQPIGALVHPTVAADLARLI